MFSNVACQNDESQQLAFVHALVYLRHLLKDAIDQTENVTSTSITQKVDPGTLHFGAFLNELERIKEQELLFDTIHARREELHTQKEYWRLFIEERLLSKDMLFYNTVAQLLLRGTLLPCIEGCGGTYFLLDEQSIPRFVIKPVDEDVFCLNNRKEMGSPFNDMHHRVRETIPLYRSAQTEAFCYELACLAGLENVTPRAVLGIASHDNFYDLSIWKENTGMKDKEKLCSIQEFIPNTQDFFDLLHQFYAQQLSDKEISEHFDSCDFEQACLFVWLTYDNDAHGGNFLTYVKAIEKGKKIYGLKKIDNGLALPEKNTQYFNALAWAPSAMAPLSFALKHKIAELPMESILQCMDTYDLSACKAALQERVHVMQTLAYKENITLAEMDARLSFLGRVNGLMLALDMAMSTQEIIAKILQEDEAAS